MIGVIGLGLVGGSLAKALLRDGQKVCGFDSLPGTRELAASFGVEVINKEEIYQKVDLLFIATPPALVAGEVVRALRAGVKTVTDTSSIKAPIHRAVEEALPDPLERRGWIGGHPMAGRQVSGWRSSDAELLRGCTWALTAEDDPGIESALSISRALASLDVGFVPAYPERHDLAVAASSALVQLLHTALSARLADDPPLLHRLSGPALKDTTRLGESPYSGMWEDVLSMSPETVEGALSDLIEELESIRASLATEDMEKIRTLWRHGSLGRERLVRSRWEKQLWREGSVPLGSWWSELQKLGEAGILLRDFEVDEALFLFQRTS